jgi:hypothetical protein
MAYDALVERNMSQPRARLFALLTDFGGIGKLLPDAIASCECKGSGVGAVRTIKLAAGGTVVERMEIAHAQSVFAYSILENDALPLTSYCAVVILDDDGKGGTRVSYGSNWIPTAGTDESGLRGQLEGLYNAILDAMARAA